MKLSKEEYQHIFKKYLAGKARPEEVLFVETYYNAFETEQDFTDTLSDEQRFHLEANIKQRIDAPAISEKSAEIRPFVFWMKYAAAAVLCLVMSISIYFYLENRGTAKHSKQTAANKQKADQDVSAMLKLANGKVLSLDSTTKGNAILDLGGVIIERTDEGELVYNHNPDANGVANRFNEIAIPKGKQFRLVLPDGTKVWLNTASTLRFPVVFGNDERRVLLTGEAFFEVAKDKNRPFLVQSRESEIRVTGTKFNVAAYLDEKMIKTTLVEGGVEVYCNNERLQLKPGEQAISNLQGQTIKKLAIDLDAATAWKDGYFVFDQSLDQIMRTLERWYDIDIHMAQDVPRGKVAGRFSRSRDFRQILSYLGQFSGFKFNTDGNKVFITKNSLN